VLCAVYEDFSREEPADASAYTTEPVTRTTTANVTGAVVAATASPANSIAVGAAYSACGVQGLYLRCVLFVCTHATVYKLSSHVQQ
jgi:hypothetical protein